MWIVNENSIIFTPAYPPADNVARVHLLDAPSTSDEVECKRYIRSFLSSLFKSALTEAERLFPLDGKMSYTYAYMAMEFYKFFANPFERVSFYETVVKDSSNGAYNDMWSSFTNLKDKLEQRCSDWPPADVCPLLISIDEVHVLYTHRREDQGSNYTLYSRLTSVLNEGVKFPFATISLSTAIHDLSLTPSKKMAPSMRERNYERRLPAPFTELPFDVFIAAEPLAPDQATLTSVGSLKFTAKFGRPL